MIHLKRISPRSHHHIGLLCFVLLVASCTPDEPAQTTPDVDGSYTIIVGSNEGWTNDCPVDIPLVDTVGFVGMSGALYTGVMEIVQEGSALTLDFEGCAGLTGAVSLEGIIDVSGPCTYNQIELEIMVGATFSMTDGIRNLDGLVSVDVDANDGAGGGPDGVVDCAVSGDLQGSY